MERCQVHEQCRSESLVVVDTRTVIEHLVVYQVLCKAPRVPWPSESSQQSRELDRIFLCVLQTEKEAKPPKPSSRAGQPERGPEHLQALQNHGPCLHVMGWLGKGS